jgi:hypothetical protein
MESKASVSTHMSRSDNPLGSKEARARIVKAIVDFVKGTRLEPQPFEQTLLGLFVEGQMTIEEVIQRLETA